MQLGASNTIVDGCNLSGASFGKFLPCQQNVLLRELAPHVESIMESLFQLFKENGVQFCATGFGFDLQGKIT